MCGPIAAMAAFCDETFDCVKYIEMKYKKVVVDRFEGFLVILVDKKKNRKRKDLENIFEKLTTKLNGEQNEKEEDIIGIVSKIIKNVELAK